MTFDLGMVMFVGGVTIGRAVAFGGVDGRTGVVTFGIVAIGVGGVCVWFVGDVGVVGVHD